MRFLGRDASADEVKLRNSSGSQFDLAMETTVSDIVNKYEQQFDNGKVVVAEQELVEKEDVKSSGCDKDIDIGFIEQQSQMLAFYAQAAGKPLSTLEKGEVSNIHFEDELQLDGDSEIPEKDLEVSASERLIYTCQVPDSVGLIKCSIMSPVQETKDFIPWLHILDLDV